LELLLDREPIKSFTVTPPRGHKNYELVDRHLKVRIPVTAGPHNLGVTFVKKSSALLETKRQPYNAHFNMHGIPARRRRFIRYRSTDRTMPKGLGIVRVAQDFRGQACESRR
jgi:hypothetical protein